MGHNTVEYHVNCKRCGTPIGYSGMMYERMKEYGQSRPEYCEDCRRALTLEKMTMGAAYFSVQTKPGADLSIRIPGELGMVYHPQRPHIKVETPSTFDASKFGATPDKIVELYQWFLNKDHQVAIVVGATGSGKSTALPYWLLFPPEDIPDDFFIRDGQILITQPRIVATTSIAEYMGVLLGSSVGKGFDVGYRYSRDRNADRFNAAFLATDGTLINLIKNGQIGDLGMIIIDEAHERSLNIDTILRILKDQLPLYPHLRVLILSATIDQEMFVDFFGRDTATVVEFEAKRKYDYKKYFEDEANALPYDDPRTLREFLVPTMVNKISWLLKEMIAGRKTRGNTLAFLHGVDPINQAVVMLRTIVDTDPILKDEIEIFPLYSALTLEEAEMAIKGVDKNKIRVAVCTNVAEASITVEGTVYVVDSGVENQAQWYIEEKRKSVELRLISKANALQRWGRSGRTAPGEVYTLYTKKQFESMLDYPVPAIQRSSMDDMILLLKEMGIDDLADGWIQAPVSEELQRSYGQLQQINAIDEDGMLTEYGALLRDFSYNATLTDLIVLADRFGVAVEVSTLLPVIRTGGSRQFLVRDDEWDAQTRNRVKMIHEGLMSNCRDDVEFILLLYAIWKDPPRLKSDTRKRPSLKDRRAAWAEEYFIDFSIFEDDVEPEKEQIMSLLSGRKKNQRIREVNFGLIDRVRVILAFCIPYKPIDPDQYRYKTHQDLELPATYQLDLDQGWQSEISSLLEADRSYLAMAQKLTEWETAVAEETMERLLNNTDSADEWVRAVSAVWFEQISSDFPIGSIVQTTVKSALQFGVFLTLPNGQDGFVHISQINSGQYIRDASAVVTIGQTIKGKVVDYDLDRLQVHLSLDIPENDPYNLFPKGSIVKGIITNLKDYGAFVSLPLGNIGMIHVSKFGRRIGKPSDVVSIGDQVWVEILDVKKVKGSTRISLKLDSLV